MSDYNIDTAFRRIDLLEEGNDLIRVDIRLIFLRIGELDTQAEHYQAHVAIEARWIVPSKTAEDEIVSSLSEEDQIRLNDGEFVKLGKDFPDNHWHPQLFLFNVSRNHDQDIKYIIKKRHSALQIREFRDVYGKFYSKFDLHHFPTDIQELSVSIGSALFDNEVILEVDPNRASGINREAFIDQQEWQLYDHIQTRTKFIKGFLFQNDDDDQLDSPGHERKRSILTIACHAARRAKYYYWNGYCPIFLITAIAFSSFAVPPNGTVGRLSIGCTLLLTSIAFRWTISNSLPNISYLTMVDMYAMVSVFVLIVLCAWHAIIGMILYIFHLSDGVSPGSYWTWLDRYVSFALIGVYIISHCALIIWYYNVPMARRRQMIELDREYHQIIDKGKLSIRSSANLDSLV